MSTQYVIRGGVEGRERLRVLARVMHPTSSALLDRLGLSSGMRCLDLGCGGGDVTMELARRVAPNGVAVGIDLDETKIAIAREEARERGVSNVEFHAADIRTLSLAPFDLVYARFLLTHLSDPSAALRLAHGLIRPGGQIAVEDIDFSGLFVDPPLPAFDRYHDLYCTVVRRRGGDPDIGPRLARLVLNAAFEQIEVSVVQPMGLTGEAKLLNPLTMQNICPALLAEGLAGQDEIDQLVADLHAYAADPATLAGVPRIFQVSGRRP